MRGCDDSLIPITIDSVPLTPTPALAFLSGLRPFLARSIPKWCSLAAQRRLHSWAGYPLIYRLTRPRECSLPGCITSESGEIWHTWPLLCYGREWLPPPSNRPIGRIKPPRENPSIHTSARTSSLVEELCKEARLLTRCHRIMGGYFPDVDLLRGCHRPQRLS